MKKRAPKVPDIRYDETAKKYYLEYYDPKTGKRVRPRISNRRDITAKRANDIFREMVAIDLGREEKTYDDINLIELEKLYFQSKYGRIANSSYRRYKTFSRNFLKYMNANFTTIKNASQLRRVHVDELLVFQKDIEMHGVSTLNRQIFLIKNMMRYAVAEGYIQESKVELVKPFRDVKLFQKTSYWTRDEVNAILENARTDWRDPLEFMYVAGLRPGEMINLTWDDVKIDNSPPTLTIQGKKDWDAKTKGIKIIPINSRAVFLIHKQTKSDKHNRIFKGPQGGKIKYDDLRHRLDESLNKLGLSGSSHKFRHSFATHLAEKGITIQSIKELLGHKYIEQTMRYAQLGQDHLKDASESLLEN